MRQPTPMPEGAKQDTVATSLVSAVYNARMTLTAYAPGKLVRCAVANEAIEATEVGHTTPSRVGFSYDEATEEITFWEK